MSGAEVFIENISPNLTMTSAQASLISRVQPSSIFSGGDFSRISCIPVRARALTLRDVWGLPYVTATQKGEGE